MAEALADRVLREAPASSSLRLRHAFRLCLAREPSPLEASRLTGWLNRQKAQGGKERPAWLFVSRVLLNTDEFITRE